MSSEGTRIFNFNQYRKPDKEPTIICADIEILFTARVDEHIPCGI